MSGIFWRILLGVLAFVFVWMLIPPICRILGLPLEGDVLTVVKVCIAAIVVFWIIRGPNPPWIAA